MADVEVNGAASTTEQPHGGARVRRRRHGDDEDEAKKFRPADIDADVREMERRRRVDTIIHSRTFREDLERIVDQQMSGPAGLFAIQQHISDITGIGISFFHPPFLFCARACALPVARKAKREKTKGPKQQKASRSSSTRSSRISLRATLLPAEKETNTTMIRR